MTREREVVFESGCSEIEWNRDESKRIRIRCRTQSDGRRSWENLL